MCNIFLQVLQFCLSYNKTQTIFNCSARFYQTFFELIEQEYLTTGRITFDDFKQLYEKETFYGGSLNVTYFSII